jgi:hypothetical protein
VAIMQHGIVDANNGSLAAAVTKGVRGPTHCFTFFSDHLVQKKNNKTHVLFFSVVIVTLHTDWDASQSKGCQLQAHNPTTEHLNV